MSSDTELEAKGSERWASAQALALAPRRHLPTAAKHTEDTRRETSSVLGESCQGLTVCSEGLMQGKGTGGREGGKGFMPGKPSSLGRERPMGMWEQQSAQNQGVPALCSALPRCQNVTERGAEFQRGSVPHKSGGHPALPRSCLISSASSQGLVLRCPAPDDGRAGPGLPPMDSSVMQGVFWLL